MGAFDGLRIPYDEGYPTVGFDNTYNYFSNQSSFSFFKGFGIGELRARLADAETRASDTVYIPQPRSGQGSIGLHIWYVRALIKEHFGTE